MDTTANKGNVATSIRFSLRSVLLVIALLSIPFTLLHWLGSAFLLPIAVSSCLVGACSWHYRIDSPKKCLSLAAIAVPLSLVFSFFYVMLVFRIGGSGLLMVHAFFNAIACFVCIGLKCPPKLAVPAFIIVAVVPYAMMASQISEAQRRLGQLLVDHPLKSLESRLEFENDTSITPNEDIAQVALSQLSPTVLENLDNQEQRYGWRREWSLTELHENYRRQFEAAAGFGFVRMRRVYPEHLEPLPIEFVELPLPVGDGLLGADSPTGTERLHQAVTNDFLDRDKIGYVRDQAHVAGFQPHSPTRLSEALANSHSCGSEPEVSSSHWQLTRLELVSILRHSPPRAYLADSLPAMDKLDQFEHRALTEFEADCLPKLRTDADVVFEQHGRQLLMVGALRASKDCLACHQGNKGKLLGAFSYEFVRQDTGADDTEKIANAHVEAGFHSAANQP